MSAATDRFNALVPRVLHLVVGVVVIGFGYYWFLQPEIAGLLKNRKEVQTLEMRVRMLEETAMRSRGMAWPDETHALALFEKLVSKEDRVADVAELMTRAVAESATDGKLRNLAMGTGEQSSTGPGAVPSGQIETIDARWGLYPYTLTHTPVTLSFDASYATILAFFSKLRDLPTAIEIRSVKLTRGLPLMRTQVTLFVFRRGDMIPGSGYVAPATPGPAAPPPVEPVQPTTFNPLAPRVKEPSGPGA
ncbi:MAG: hypothetical protein WCP29_17095 [Acidobacteriota bacterium]